MKKDLLSVIIPVYNGERYLRECLDSLVSQTYENKEIIIVNDGSTDNSESIVNEYTNKYDYIRLVNQKNSGVSVSRNNGIENASGEFIAFVDCDDTVESNAYELVISRMKKEAADIAVFRYKRFRESNNSFTNYGIDVDKIYDSNTVLSDFFSLDENKKLGEANWNKVFKRNVIKNIRFERIRIGEDYLFNYHVLCNAKKIINIPIVLYNYRITSNSATTSRFNIEKLRESIYSRKTVLEHVSDNNPNYFDQAYYYLCDAYYYAVLKFNEEHSLNCEDDFLSLVSDFKKFASSSDYKRIYDNTVHGKHVKKFIKNYKFCIFVNNIKFHIKKLLRRKKKVGILTINDSNNYGNRLQNYALYKFLKNNNYDAYSIKNYYSNLSKKQYYKICFINIIKKYILFFNNKYKRKINFLNFDRNIKYSNVKIFKNSIPKNINNKFDFFLVGSDQVWNPTFERTSCVDFLSFASSKKKNSFSASIGISDIPDKYKNDYINYLSDFNKISVREDRAKELVSSLGRNDVEVLVDPTMLLTADDWNKVSKKPKNLGNQKYVLNYFLGELSLERKKMIDDFARENDCNVINLLDKNDPYYCSGPSEFLYLEKHAFLICTDSFHSSVFAILYNRPFVIFDREQKGMVSMNSRINTLLNKFQINDRMFDKKLKLDNYLKYDYSNSYEILETERNKAIKFLNSIEK